MKTVTLSGANITDDKWHTVRVSRRGNTVSLQLDFKAKAYATTGTFCICHCSVYFQYFSMRSATSTTHYSYNTIQYRVRVLQGFNIPQQPNMLF
jgi:hypothetical protein